MMSIYNFEGKLLFSRTIESGDNSINSGVPNPGIYILEGKISKLKNYHQLITIRH